MKAEITFTSGATIVVDVEELTLERNTLTKELMKVKWTDVDTTPRRGLFYLRVENVDAIVFVEEGENSHE